MDLNLASIVKAALILAFILPAFALIASTLPTNPPSVLISPNQGAVMNLSAQMNSTSLYIQENFLKTESGLNSTLIGKNGSFSANPTIFQAFAFIVSGFGTIMQDVVMLPYLDYTSLNFLVNGMSFAMPAYVIGFVKVGVDLLDAYMIFCLGILGVSAIEKYNLLA